MSDQYQDLFRAMEFAQSRFDQWGHDRTIGGGFVEAITRDYNQQREAMNRAAREGQPLPADLPLQPADQCWNCRGALAAGAERCPSCGVPVRSAMAQDLRYWLYVCHRIKAHCDAGRLPLSQAHAAMNDAKSRLAVIRNRLENDRAAEPAVAVEVIPDDKPAASDAPAGSQPTQPGAAVPPGGQEHEHAAAGGGRPSMATAYAAAVARMHAPRRPLWEIILDPRTIQWLLGLGGVLFVLGLVIWLATLGIFENRLVVAVALGAANLVMLTGGWAIIRFSRYQTAGRAITLLACLVMPLNLWFYHSQDLVTLDGHLWVAALVCSVLYLASALVLRDHVFVYVLVGGIAMTGLLMLTHAGRFWEIAAPATMLVAMALLSIHLERAFPEIEGPFSRRRFGMAFFRSGHILLAAGLLLVLGAQIVGDWLYGPIFKSIYDQRHLLPPAIVQGWGQYLALALVLAGTYAYFYSDIVVRRVGLYVYLAVFTLLWAEMLVIELLQPTQMTEVAIIALAVTGLAANLCQPKLLKFQKNGDAQPEGFAATAVSFVRAGQPLGLALSSLPVLLGLVLHLRATYQPLSDWHMPGGGPYTIGWLYVAAMAATAISCRLGAHLYRHTIPWLSATYFFGTAAATLIGLSGLLTVLGIRTWDQLAPLVMVVPIIYIIAARLYRGHTQEKPLVWVAHSATGVMIVAVLAAATHLTPQHVFEPIVAASQNLLLAAFFAEAAVFYALAAAFRKQGFNVYLATAAACGALWQLLSYWQVGAEYYTVLFAGLGFVLLVAYRLAVLEWTGLAKAAFQCANALMSLSFVAAALITLSRLASHPDQIHYSLVALLGALVALSLLAAWLVQDAAGRRWYIVVAIAEAGLAFFTLNVLSTLTMWDKLEIFCIVVGIASLVIGHIGWHRERDQQSDLVSFSLLCGSLLVGLPLAIAVLIHRCQPTPQFSTLNELGMLTAGILLLATGFILQLRATTITGAGLLLVYLVSLVLYIHMPENIKPAAIWMTIGGGLLIGTAILLSIYRDRLLTLPDRVRRREGVFRVLSWR